MTLHESVDRTKDLTPEQYDALLRWGDTLLFYRKTSPEAQQKNKLALAFHEKRITGLLDDITLVEVDGVLKDREGFITDDLVLCCGPVEQSIPFSLNLPPSKDKRFGYEFHLVSGLEPFVVALFFKGKAPSDTATVYKLRGLEPIYVIDLPEGRNYQPYPLI